MNNKVATNAATRTIIKKYDITAKKNFGQNFLIDTHVINKIIAAAEISKDDLIIEIGPGLGSLTQFLADNAKKCIAIEIDKSMVEVLNETLAEYGNVRILNNDILKTDIQQLITEEGFTSTKVVANLPYYITTPIIMSLLENRVPISVIVVMVQKEVAARIAAKPSTKDYGALSVAVQYYAEPYLAANVPQNCFIPRPNVDSAVIKLTVRKTPKVSVSSEKLLFSIIKAAFMQRRKTLVNCLYNFPEFDFSKEQIINILKACDISENIRGEDLAIEQFALICERMFNTVSNETKP